MEDFEVGGEREDGPNDKEDGRRWSFMRRFKL